MKTGIFGAFNEPDDFQNVGKELAEIHHRRDQITADAEETLRKKKAFSESKSSEIPPQIPTRASADGRARSKYLCVVTFDGMYHASQERSFEGENATEAIATSLKWTKAITTGSDKTRLVDRVRLLNLIVGGPGDTFGAKACYEWKNDGTSTLDQELERALKKAATTPTVLVKTADEITVRRLHAKADQLRTVLQRFDSVSTLKPIPRPCRISYANLVFVAVIGSLMVALLVRCLRREQSG